MKNYNVLFLGLFSTVLVSSMDDHSDKFKDIQDRISEQTSLGSQTIDNNNSQGPQVQGKLRELDGKINAFQRIRQARVQELKELLKASQDSVREVQERHQKRLNDNPDHGGNVSEDDEDYDDFNWKTYELDKLGNKK